MRNKHSNILGALPTAASGLREPKKNNEERGGLCAGKRGLLAGRYWPLARFVAPKADKFCLFPADESGGPIQFEPEDVTLLCYQASIGDQFYVEEFFSMCWYTAGIYTLHNTRIFISAIIRTLNAKQTLE